VSPFAVGLVLVLVSGLGATASGVIFALISALVFELMNVLDMQALASILQCRK
jgi:hypothetical protein